VSSYTFEVLGIQSYAPILHVIFALGNLRVILDYKDFVEFLYDLLEEFVVVITIGHLYHSRNKFGTRVHVFFAETN